MRPNADDGRMASNSIRDNSRPDLLEKLEKMRRDKFSLDTIAAVTYNYQCVALYKVSLYAERLKFLLTNLLLAKFL